MKIVVLIATYNGSIYIRAQLDSILAQTVPVDIVLRDDNSKDNTMEIMTEYEQKYENVHVIRGVPGGGSSKKNFGLLLGLKEIEEYDYVMYADQDDIWLPKKVEKTLECMRALEQQHGKECPILVHTDLELVDGNGKPLAPSFWKYNGFNPALNALPRLLVDNTVTGCTMMMNASLRDMAVPMPENVSMHDAWPALIACAFGKIGIVYEPTMQYRQHGNNVIGATGKENFFTKAKVAIDLTFSSKQRESNTLGRVVEAQVFLDRFGQKLSPEQRKIVTTFAHIYSFSRLKRVIFFFRYGFYKQRMVKTLGLLLIWLLQKKS